MLLPTGYQSRKNCVMLAPGYFLCLIQCQLPLPFGTGLPGTWGPQFGHKGCSLQLRHQNKTGWSHSECLPAWLSYFPHRKLTHDVPMMRKTLTCWGRDLTTWCHSYWAQKPQQFHGIFTAVLCLTPSFPPGGTAASSPHQRAIAEHCWQQGAGAAEATPPG